MSNLQAPKEFEPVESSTEANRLIREGAHTLSGAILWTLDQKETLTTHLNGYSESEGIFTVNTPKDPKDGDLARFQNHLRDQSQLYCLFSVTLPKAILFFRSDFINVVTGKIRFKLPEKIFRVQRRKDMRYTIPHSHVLRVEFQDPSFNENRLSKKAVDLSAQGLGFSVSVKESTLFKKGLALKDVTFSVRNRKIECVAEVRHVKPSADPDTYRVGISFAELKAADGNWIANYVLEEGRKSYFKFV